MRIQIPCIQKVSYKNNIFIERALPSEGKITVTSGQEIRPYTELGQTTSHILLSGVWGSVEDIIENRAVLIKSHSVDLHLVMSSSEYAEGELIVFPNPSDIIQRQYLEKFAYSLAGKVIYTGNTVGLDTVQLAQKYGVSGIITGGCTRPTFDFARKAGFFLGLFSGFGNCRTPDVIFDVLSDVSTRIVFLSAEDHCVRIPMPSGFSGVGEPLEEPIFKPLERGLKVLVLQTPYFGDTGRILQVEGFDSSRVFAKLATTGETVVINVPNLLAL